MVKKTRTFHFCPLKKSKTNESKKQGGDLLSTKCLLDWIFGSKESNGELNWKNSNWRIACSIFFSWKLRQSELSKYQVPSYISLTDFENNG